MVFNEIDPTKLYNCPDCKSQRMTHTLRDDGHWTFVRDKRGFKVPGKFVTTGKILTRNCPDCGYKTEVKTL